LGLSERPEARLYRAAIYERDGRYDEANVAYRTLIRGSAPNSPCRREASLAILREAIHAINSGMVGPAMDDLREVLEADPTNFKAIYVMQLACLRCGKRDEVIGLGKQLDAICQRFQHPVMDAVRSAGQQNNFVSALDRDDLTSAIEAYQKAQSP
jgi:tetratricopeptide (TPR) repeat protein